MALTTVASPPGITPARNPVWLEYTAGGYRTTAPTRASYKLAIRDQPSEGQQFTVVLPTVSIQFTFVNGVPDDSGTQARIGANTTQTTEYLAEALASNWYVAQYFLSVFATPNAVLTAHQLGNTPLSIINTDPATINLFDEVPGVAAQFQPNYTAHVRVLIERTWGSGIYEEAATAQLDPDPGDRRVRLDIASILLPATGYDWPAYNRTTTLISRAIQRRYRIARYEQWGDPPQPKAVQYSPIKRAWFAGSRNLEHVQFDDLLLLIRRTDTTTPFLTYRGRGAAHEVSPRQQHYLGWLRNKAKVTDQQHRIHVVVNYISGDPETTTLHTDTNSSQWNLHDVAIFPAGFNTCGLHMLDPTRTAVSYSFTVHDHAGTPQSETHTFHLVPEDANERHIEGINSMGVIESLRCKGQWVRGLETRTEEVNRLRTIINNVKPSRQTADHAALLRGHLQTIRISTGFLPRTELNAALDILFSPELRLVDHALQTREPLRIIDAEHQWDKRGTDDEHLHALNLTLAVGDPEMAWSDRAAIPAIGAGGTSLEPSDELGVPPGPGDDNPT